MISENKSGIIWIGASQIALLVSNLFLLKLLTTKLTIYEYGQFTLYMSIALFVRQLLYDPFSIVLGKECAANQKQVADGFLVARTITDRIGVILLLVGSSILIYSKLTNASDLNSIAIAFCLIYICANGAQGLYFNILNSTRQRKPASIFSIIDSATKILFVSLAVSFIDSTLIYSLASISLSSFIIFYFLRNFISKRIVLDKPSTSDTHSISKRIILMSTPFVIPTVIAGAKTVGDRWMLAGFLGVNDLAGYSTLLQIGYFPIVLFIGMIQTLVAPKIYGLCSMNDNQKNDELKQFLKKLIFLILAGAIAASASSMVLGSWVFKILVGTFYHDLSIYLPFFVISGALTAATGILQVAIIGYFRSRDASILLIVSLLTSIILTAFLIVTLSFKGAIAGLVISSSSTLIIYFLSLNRALRLRIK